MLPLEGMSSTCDKRYGCVVVLCVCVRQVAIRTGSLSHDRHAPQKRGHAPHVGPKSPFFAHVFFILYFFTLPHTLKKGSVPEQGHRCIKGDIMYELLFVWIFSLHSTTNTRRVDRPILQNSKFVGSVARDCHISFIGPQTLRQERGRERAGPAVAA